MAKSKERTTINFDTDVYEKVVALRMRSEYVRMSVSAIVNMLLEMALERVEVR